MNQPTQDNLKKEAGEKAAELVKSDMIIGLGTGTTVKYLVDALGSRVQSGELNFTAVTTSTRTADHARTYGIKIVDIDDVDHIDLTIDGADEIDPHFNGIKGGGGALLWEKIVAINSDRYVWIVDESKMVQKLGHFPLPVEVIPFGSGQVLNLFKKRGYNPTLRMDDNGQPFKTDEDNVILDLHLEEIDDPVTLARDLITTVGVVEQGLFIDMVDEVIMATLQGPKTLENPYKPTVIVP